MSETIGPDAGRRHWFYDSKGFVALFCLISMILIGWQVSRFEGFEPIFTCGSREGIDEEVFLRGMRACMANADSQAAQARCMHVVYVLACTDERWR
ncbi:hypothetical protein MKK75_31100 [Methylobacterium sp. J-030]|uniref:hypothetical protein n=1 Tax=Methylobacterium sp. J-030 TaxID=2836627 RepID=UPI001FBA5E2A|nr:hypothetical protein [Methylobacterium sp. J-030]MCJ2073182.1 hypothetical protein [Methylobacterium sp. J-030]